MPALLILCSGAGAQNATDTVSYKRLVKFPLLSIRYFNYSNSEFTASESKGDVYMEEFNTTFQFAFPIKKKKTYLINRVNLNRLSYRVEIDDEINKEAFYAFGYTFGLTQVLKNRWRLVATVTPTLASDFKNEISSEDLIVQSAAILSKRSSPFFEYGFGAAFSTRFGRELLVPVLSLTYKNERWGTFMFLPAYISQYYHFDQSRVGFSLSTYGNVYNYTPDIKGDYELDKLGYSRINIGPEFRTRLWKDVHINVSTGITVRNRLESINGRGTREFDISTKEKFYFKVELNILK
ncbi:DUF6268 family outer membrane beta-barrel protein [Carboxylicivirga sp. RSCT41]|uniref:DUF6268 family outer membrane beta-barrel protein n=1 Tax=Carboxylicivirga agarovorans TaxID=3417570 RepID=UPI003D33F6C5